MARDYQGDAECEQASISVQAEKPKQGLGNRQQCFFTWINDLASKHDVIHLGQGFPNVDGPDYIKEAAINAIKIPGNNQYTPPSGIRKLNQAIANFFYKDTGMNLVSEEEITVTNGCMEAMSSTIFGLLKPGDEVVMFEPFYFSHMAVLKMMGAKVKIVRLRPSKFSVSEEDLRAAFSNNTRAIILSSPHNPTGKVFSREELELIASLCIKHDSLVFSDEVYFKLVFEGEHISIATLDGMFERTVTMNSIGKTFFMTGWRIGWTIAPSHLTEGIRYAHTNLTFSASTPLQFGAIAALESPDSYYTDLVRQCRDARDLLVEGLRSIGFIAYEPQGTFSILADISPFGFKDNIDFCVYLVESVGVAALPMCGSYDIKEDGEQLVRFDFCKDLSTLRDALERMRKHLPLPHTQRG